MQPTKKTLRILAMSDTHDTHQQLDPSTFPPADIFVHAGDFTQYSYRGQLTRFRQFLSKLPYKHKIVIAGNHDFALDTINYENKLKPKRHQYEKMDTKEEIEKLKEVCTYLDHEEIEIEGVRIFGSPYQPLYYNWGFQYHNSRADQIWSVIPEGIQLLITHGPPKGILDECEPGNNIGCPTLAKKVQEIKPKVHIFGHVHKGYGNKEVQGIRYYNVSMLDEAYQVVNPPTLIEFEIE